MFTVVLTCFPRNSRRASELAARKNVKGHDRRWAAALLSQLTLNCYHIRYVITTELRVRLEGDFVQGRANDLRSERSRECGVEIRQAQS